MKPDEQDEDAGCAAIAGFVVLVVFAFVMIPVFHYFLIWSRWWLS